MYGDEKSDFKYPISGILGAVTKKWQKKFLYKIKRALIFL